MPYSRLLFSSLYFCRLLLCLSVWLSACIETPVPTPTATPPPTLNASLWVDYPVVSNGYRQAANVVVNDTRGQPVEGAVVIGEYITPESRQLIDFPSTDKQGRTRVTLPVQEPITNTQTIILTVKIVQNAEWGEGRTTFQVVP